MIIGKSYNTKKIVNYQAKIDRGGLSDKRVQSLQNRINRLNDNSSMLDEVRTEINVLDKSDQVYDIQTNDSWNILGVEYRGGSEIDGSTGIFKMEVPSLYTLPLFAHELKHAYQFEIGEYSSGRNRNGAPFYDQTDELAAYERGALFGGDIRTAVSIANDPIYQSLQLGPVDITIWPSSIYSNPAVLQRLADQLKSAFRVNGVTYIGKDLKK